MVRKDDALADRKEVFDYLRNLQKAEEIAAKRSGISVWVIWGALWFVTWKILENTGFTLSVFKWSLDLVIISQILATLFISSPIQDIGDGPRFLNLRFFSISEAPSLLLMTFLWSIAPSAIEIYLFGFSLLNIVVGGILISLFGYGVWLEFADTKRRFPKPTFRTSSSIKLTLIWCLTVIVFCVMCFPSPLTYRLLIGSEAGKYLILTISFFWLIYVLLETHQKHYNDAWTYRTERELLLGTITSEAALRRIEQRYLGEKLSSVIDGYWDEVAIEMTATKVLIDKFKTDSAEIQKIPKEYPNEIKSRCHNAEKLAQQKLKSLLFSHREFTTYIQEILASQKFNLSPQVLDAIKNAKAKNMQSVEELNTLVEIFNAERAILGLESKFI
ncbi:MAG: hypothetical protein WBL62_10065 [Gallionella sp.]